MIIEYIDGTVYTKHADGTEMLNKDNLITVEHSSFATVVINQGNSVTTNIPD